MTTNGNMAQPAGVEEVARMEDNSMNGNDAVYAEPALRPCPFCGETPVADSYYMNQGDKWGGVACNNCDAHGPEVRTYYEPWPAWKLRAIEEWNRRATPADLAERARRAASTVYEFFTMRRGGQTRQEITSDIAAIITAEFAGGGDETLAGENNR